MIREEGIIIDHKNNLVKVRIDSKTSCHSCKLCSRGKEGMILEVSADSAFSQGDPVDIDIEGRNLLLCFFILYLFPVMSFILGIVIGMISAKMLSYEKYLEPFEIISGFLFFTISIFFVNWFDKRYKDKVKISVKLKTEG